MIKAFSKHGLPLKITAEYTKDVYHYYNSNEELCSDAVEGWLVRINGMKYPRGHTDGDGTPDWTYRYTRHGRSEEGRRIAIEQALISAGFKESVPVDAFGKSSIMNNKGVENVR